MCLKFLGSAIERGTLERLNEIYPGRFIKMKAAKGNPAPDFFDVTERKVVELSSEAEMRRKGKKYGDHYGIFGVDYVAYKFPSYES